MKDIMDFVNSDYNRCTCLNKLPIAYSYTPVQELDTVYDYEEGLNSGTIFPELNLPLGVYGKNFGKTEDIM